ncbi:hypothetical protein HYQ46_011348 [Verticillium longisporum]|nr:hypothetical protein HYQ46_011348 [Verticillium longisporum]
MYRKAGLHQAVDANEVLGGMLEVGDGDINAGDAFISGLAQKQVGLAVVVDRERLDELQDGQETLVDLGV